MLPGMWSMAPVSESPVERLGPLSDTHFCGSEGAQKTVLLTNSQVIFADRSMGTANTGQQIWNFPAVLHKESLFNFF